MASLQHSAWCGSLAEMRSRLQISAVPRLLHLKRSCEQIQTSWYGVLCLSTSHHSEMEQVRKCTQSLEFLPSLQNFQSTNDNFCSTSAENGRDQHNQPLGSAVQGTRYENATCFDLEMCKTCGKVPFYIKKMRLLSLCYFRSKMTLAPASVRSGWADTYVRHLEFSSDINQKNK
jgi:hypothetical protein